MKNQSTQSADQMDSSGQSGGRKVAEWVTILTSLAIILFTVGYLTFSAIHPNSMFVPIRVKFDYQHVKQDGGHWILPMQIANTGDRAVRNVIISLTYTHPA